MDVSSTAAAADLANAKTAYNASIKTMKMALDTYRSRLVSLFFLSLLNGGSVNKARKAHKRAV